MDWCLLSPLHHVLGWKSRSCYCGNHRVLVWCSKFWLCGLILTRLLLFLRITTFPQNLRNPHATSETAQKLQLTWNSSAFSSLQTFLQTASKKREKKPPTTNRKVAALLKFLCLSNQSGDLLWGRSMKASCRQSQPWACYLLWAPLGEKTSSGIQVKRAKELAHVSPREVTDSWQHPLDPEAASVPERWWRREVGWKEGETIFGLRDGAPFRILGQMKNSSWSGKKPWISKNTQREEELCLQVWSGAAAVYAPSFPPLLSTAALFSRPLWCRGRKRLKWSENWKFCCFCFYIYTIVHLHDRDKSKWSN